MVLTEEPPCCEGAPGTVNYDYAIYFPRTCLRLCDFLGVNFLPIDSKSNYCVLKKTA